jgi:hypothetical protein
MKKKLVGITREHEALVNFVETNKHICTEKEKQKVKEKAFSIITLNHMTPNLLNRHGHSPMTFRSPPDVLGLFPSLHRYVKQGLMNCTCTV